VISFGKFEPDRTKYAPDATTNVINCLPVADGWGPLPDLSVISTALAATCLGAVYIRTSAGAYRIIAGTATKLYEFNSATLGWTDISRLAGGDYAVPDGDLWSFEPFGLNLIAANLADDIQYLNIDSGTNFAALAGSPPKCKYLATAGEYLLMGHLASFPNRVQTSGIGDATYHTVGQRGADFQDFPDGEEIVGIIGAERGAIIFQRTRIRQLTIANTGDYSFHTAVINPNRGVVAPHSIATIGPGRFVYYSADGFFMGAEGTPIGRERVDEWFGSTIDQSTIEDIRGMVDPYKKVVWFQATTTDSSTFMLGYQWALDRWCYADFSIEMMASLVTPAITIDGMDAYYATFDDASEPFDSRLFTGGAPTMAVFDTSHRLCYLTGGALAATLQTPDTELNPGSRSFVDEVRVIGDVGTSYTLKAITSDYHGGTRTTGSAVTPNSTTGISYMRSESRIHAFKLEMAAGADWNHVVALDLPRPRRTGRR
jgi:hypothetical protein